MGGKEYDFTLLSSRSAYVKWKWEEKHTMRAPAGFFSGRSMLGNIHIEIEGLEILK